MSKGLDPDQDPHSVSPDLGPNCLQMFHQRTKVAAIKERVKWYMYNGYIIFIAGNLVKTFGGACDTK